MTSPPTPPEGQVDMSRLPFGPPFTSDQWYRFFPAIRAGNLTAEELAQLTAKPVKVPRKVARQRQKEWAEGIVADPSCDNHFVSTFAQGLLLIDRDRANRWWRRWMKP